MPPLHSTPGSAAGRPTREAAWSRRGAVRCGSKQTGRRRIAAAVILAALAGITTGCGTKTARLTGSVTDGGRPAAGARIDARSGHGAAVRVATGAVLPDGTYRIDYGAWPGFLPGPCRIEITHVSTPSGAALAAGEAGLVAAEAPAARRRRVVFDHTLSTGHNVVDFELDDGRPTAEP
jgi:hypothetical protein